jgi:hypothetical protein
MLKPDIPLDWFSLQGHYSFLAIPQSFAYGISPELITPMLPATDLQHPALDYS